MYGGVPLLSRHVPIVFRALTSHHAVVAGHAKLEDLCQLWIWELFHLLRDTFIFLFHVWYMGMDHTKDGQLWSIFAGLLFLGPPGWPWSLPSNCCLPGNGLENIPCGLQNVEHAVFTSRLKVTAHFPQNRQWQASTKDCFPVFHYNLRPSQSYNHKLPPWDKTWKNMIRHDEHMMNTWWTHDEHLMKTMDKTRETYIKTYNYNL